MVIKDKNVIILFNVLFLSLSLSHISVSRDLTVVFVLLLCVSLNIPVLVWCKKTDATSEENNRAHFLPDNSATDQHFYAVTVHTGLCSAARMSARVRVCVEVAQHVSGCQAKKKKKKSLSP